MCAWGCLLDALHAAELVRPTQAAEVQFRVAGSLETCPDKEMVENACRDAKVQLEM
jgi:hypothetical protein